MEEKITEQEHFTDNTAPMDINVDENVAGTTHLNEEVAEESVMEKLQMELDEQKDKYLRLVAEFDNFRKRTAKEKLDLMQTAGKDVIIPILNVLDDCDRAEAQLQNSEDVTLIKEGIQLVFAKLRSTMQSLGVKEMESIGVDFDVEKHEAITDIPAPTEEQKDKVMDQIQKGYYLNEKLIRFAKVVVGK
jgi:molecular chaperone GrpE